jgi:MFS family permease
MNKKQLAGLFLCNFAPFVVGSGALPLLPVYAAALGAPPVVAGYYLAIAYLGLAVGTFAAGWVSDRVHHRRALLVAGAGVGIPTLWWVGRMDRVWALMALTGFVWLVGGFSMALTQIVAGLTAPREARGQVYGVLGLAIGLGGLTGGLLTGPIVDRWGYPTMLAVLALFLALWLVGAPLLGPGADAPAHPSEAATRRGRARLGHSYGLLFAASLVSSIAGFVSILGRSISMNALSMTATEISSTGAIGSAAGLPLPLLVGRWSDRVGRTQFLLLSYLASTAGIVVLALSNSLWHFWVAVVLGTVGSTISSTVGPALVTDLVPRETLGRGMGLYSATGWIGAVIGFSATGHAVQAMGMLPTLIAAAALPLISIALLLPVHRARTAAGLNVERA